MLDIIIYTNKIILVKTRDVTTDGRFVVCLFHIGKWNSWIIGPCSLDELYIIILYNVHEYWTRYY